MALPGSPEDGIRSGGPDVGPVDPDPPADGADVLADVRHYYRTVSRYIDRELSDRGDEAFWRQVVRDAAAAVPRPRVLELGAGTGRVTRVLLEAGARVVGLDLSPHMLARARESVASVGSAGLIVSDMRRPAVRGPFDLVVAANDPFVHLTADRDRQIAVTAVAERLRPGGRFVLDAHWLGPTMERQAAGPGGMVRERPLADGRGTTVREEWRCDPDSSLCHARYEYRRDGRVLDEATCLARLWSVPEILHRLEGVGLSVRTFWGGYDRRPFEPGTATHLVAEAERGPAET